MERRFSEFAGRLKPSVIRRMTKRLHGRPVISFAGGLPHPETFPAAELGSIAAEVLEHHAGEALQYGLTQGYLPLVEHVLTYLEGRGMVGLKPENVLIASGSQQALDLVARVFIDPGDTALVESPGYVGATGAFTNAGARLVGVPMLEDGPDLERLESLLRRESPKFFYLTPNFSNPSGVLTTLEKRRAVYELARRHDLWIVEDDAYGEIYFSDCSASDVVPLKAADPDGRVVYLNTFSKTIAPGLRLAAMVGPPEFISVVEMAKQTGDMFTGTLAQSLAAELFRRGFFQERLPRLRAFYQARRDAMVAALKRHLPEGRWNSPRGGFFIWLELPEGLDAEELLESAVEAGVAYVPGAPFYVSGDGPPARVASTVRLAFSRETEADIARGVERLGSVVKEMRRKVAQAL